ncbi:hypothetical protein HIC20_01150 [Buchnera aphidicola (Hormaphis cornu)]|nr:hypothetical protein HIC20_01150 [Buchnera aphidicola (Hormaphis cornu)]
MIKKILFKKYSIIYFIYYSKIRLGEQNGRHYYFISIKKFKNLIKQECF